MPAPTTIINIPKDYHTPTAGTIYNVQLIEDNGEIPQARGKGQTKKLLE